MAGLMWEEEREERKNESVERHARLSKLFREDRFSFERERKSAIKELIDRVEDEGQRKRLWELQNAWDKRMKGAASAHNRFVLAQMFFWEHFHNVWTPALQEFKAVLDDPD